MLFRRNVGLRLVSLIALALNLDENFFKNIGALDSPMGFLRLLHYPGNSLNYFSCIVQLLFMLLPGTEPHGLAGGKCHPWSKKNLEHASVIMFFQKNIKNMPVD
jgi:hypothetical protein